MRSAVPGAIGPGSNYNFSSNVSTYTLGAAVGEETHTLIRAEMPSHTHGSNVASGNSNGNGLTTLDGAHSHTINDPGHAHGYTAPDSPINFGPSLINNSGVVGVSSTQTSSNFTGINSTQSTINHQHQIFNTGGDQPHNNMQPTVFIGNMFIYSGKIHGATSKWRYELDTNIL